MQMYSREDIKIIDSIPDNATKNLHTIPSGCDLNITKTELKQRIHRYEQYNTKTIPSNMSISTGSSYCDERKGRYKAIHQYINQTNQKQMRLLHAQQYDEDKGYGDILQTTTEWNTGEEINTFRVGAININGISKSLRWIEWEIILKHMNTLQVDVLGVTEPNVNFKNKSVLNTFYEMAKDHDRHMQMSTSCSNQLLSSTKKMGGTMTILDGKWAGRKLYTSNDAKGRWSSITLTGRKNRKVTIITAYRVCVQKGGIGSTVYHQQQLDFEAEGRRHVKIRKQFCDDITHTIRNLHSQNHIVILMGDFNDDLNLKGGQVNTMLRDCGLANVVNNVHGNQVTLPSTYNRGTKCLDLIAITDNESIPKSCIKSAGYLPYYHFFCTDHRFVFCDIDLKQLFGYISPELPRFLRRPFTTKNVERCELFKEKVRELYIKSNIFEIVETLSKRFENATKDNIEEIKNDCIKYGTVASQLLIGAGKAIGHSAYKKGRPYSDKLAQAAKVFHDKRNEMKFLQMKKYLESDKQKEQEIVSQIKQAYQGLRNAQNDAVKIREAFLQKLAAKRASEWNLSANVALNTIVQAEASRRTFARHGNVMKGGTKGSINDLVIPVPRYDSTTKGTEKAGWMNINDEETMFALLLRRNTQQFMRSADCPFAHGKIVESCGIDGDGIMVEKILMGTLEESEKMDLINEYSDPDDVLKLFITALAKPRNANGIPINDFEWKFGVKEFRATFRKTRESTSCGPSGLNMSYWKACSEDDDIARVQSFFIAAAFRYGFSYPRWQVSWHCMLKKKEVPYIHRLRIIQLFEGDFNGALKYLLGRLLMYHVVNNNRCDNQAFGSIPGRTAHDALVTLQLIYDNARVNKSVIASMFNDAAGCYDRIRPLLSSICMQRVGCPESISYCHALTQRKMQHRVKTGRGVSVGTITWSSNQEFKTTNIDGTDHIHGNIGGIGQGGGGSPIGWLVVLLVMIATYSLFATGIIMTDPQSLLSLTTHIISYVDDNTLVQSFDKDCSMKKILDELNKCISKWHEILQLTGGDLALEKCTFCIMKWKWSQGTATLETPVTDPGDLKVKGTTISRLRPNEGTRVLGVRLAMDGTFKDEYEYRLDQSKTFANKLYQSSLSPMDAYMVYETRYRPALEYPLRVTTFTMKELNDIQKPFIYLLLPKIGLNRHMPRDVVYGPIYRGGLGLINLEERQIIQHFESFQGHVRRNDDIGKSIRVQLATQQLEIGCGELFLNTSYSKYSYGTSNTRLSYLWQQCSRFQIKVTLSNSLIPADINGRNKTIMDFATEMPQLGTNKKKLSLLNSCRLYLHLLWPHDLLSTTSPNTIDRRYILGTQVNKTSGLNFPNQGMPGPYAWALWKEFIYGSFCTPKMNEKGKLMLELAKRSPTFECGREDVGDFQCMIESMSGNMTLQQRFQRLPPMFRDIVGNIDVPADEGQSIIHALQDGVAVAASDGSYLEDEKKGSHAYKIVNKNCVEEHIKGAAMCPASDRMSSSPAEHYGALAVLIVLVVLLHHHNMLNITFPTMVLYIDNEEVVNRGNECDLQFLNVNEFLTHDYDLWKLLIHIQRHLKITIQFEWIRGHQNDSDGLPDQLAIELNNEVDALATDIYELQMPIPQRGAFYSGQVCYHQDGYHVQDVTKAISSRESDDHLLAYYKSKGWSEMALLHVDWVAMEKFLLTQSPTARCHTIQLMHNWQNTGYQKKQFSGTMGNNCTTRSSTTHEPSIDRETKCPLGCGCVEYPFHYMQCRHETMYEARLNGITTLTKGLKRLKTAPSLQEAILHGIQCWTDDTEYELDGESHPLLSDFQHSKLLEHQTSIGWELFLKGYLAKEWRFIQGSYYKYLKVNQRKFHKNRWILQVLILLHQYRHDLWMLRNAAIHGGPEKLHGKVFRRRLLSEVQDLYKKDRSQLSLQDKELFKLPLCFREKQGNQHLLLWIKHAYIVFDTVENSKVQQQTQITDWLTNWTDDITSKASDFNKKGINGQQQQINKKQLVIDNWVQDHEDNVLTTVFSEDCSEVYEDVECIKSKQKSHCNSVQDSRIVTDGTNQCYTTNTCLLVD